MFRNNPKLKGPKCEECFPGVLLENQEAWEILQRYSNPWGADSGTILKLCEAYEVSDPLGVMEKVLIILEETQKDG